MDFLALRDGTNTAPRDVQVDYLTKLGAKWSQYRLHALSAPPGVGKSFIARSIQKATDNCAILAPTNLLVDQYVESYPELNPLKGKDYYAEPKDYNLARSKVGTADNVFNPLSYYFYYRRHDNAVRPTTVVIDEAHKLADMLLLTVTRSFPLKHYGIPLGLTEPKFLEWLETVTIRYDELRKKPKLTKAEEVVLNRYESMVLLRDYLRLNIKTVRIGYESQKINNWSRKTQQVLTVTPIVFPRNLLKTMLGEDTKVVLMSGTLNTHDLQELFGDEPVNLEVYEPLAPLENRLVMSWPIPYAQRTNTEVQVARFIQLYEKHGRPNTIVHLSYGDAPGFAMYLRSQCQRKYTIITHNKEDKNDKANEFKATGGIFLASGLAEGLDLPGDQCRLVIIPRLLYPNKGDSAVAKRLALPNGELWYSLTTMMTTVQQIGRGVRGADDWCHTYVFDCTFPRLLTTTQAYLTKGFLEGIKCIED